MGLEVSRSESLSVGINVVMEVSLIPSLLSVVKNECVFNFIKCLFSIC